MSKVISFLRGEEFIGYLGDLTDTGIFRIATHVSKAKEYTSKELLEQDLKRLKVAFPSNRFKIENK